MALPLLAGIPWLAALLASMFGAIFSWLIQFFTKRIAIVLAALAVLATVTTAFFALISGLAAGLSSATPAEFNEAIGLVMPSNVTACLTAISTAHLARWAYAWQVRIIQYKLL